MFQRRLCNSTFDFTWLCPVVRPRRPRPPRRRRSAAVRAQCAWLQLAPGARSPPPPPPSRERRSK